jgi:hypothetical protein
MVGKQLECSPDAEHSLTRDLWVVARQKIEEPLEAMGIENTDGAHQPFGIMKLQARRELRASFV